MKIIYKEIGVYYTQYITINIQLYLQYHKTLTSNFNNNN